MFLHRYRLVIPTIALVFFATIITDSASANMGGVRWDDSGFISPVHGQSTKLEIEKETLVFNCKTTGNQVICEFEATYYLLNPTEEIETVLGAFYGNNCERVTIEIDATVATQRLTEDQFRLLDQAVRVAIKGDDSLPSSGYLQWARNADDLRSKGENAHAQELIDDGLKNLPGFMLKVGPGERKTLKARGSIEAGGLFYWAAWGPAFVSPVEGRHLLLSGYPGSTSFGIEYLLSPLKTWAAVHEVEIIISYPDDLELKWKLTDSDGRPRRHYPNVSGMTPVVENPLSEKQDWRIEEEPGRIRASWKRSSEKSNSESDATDLLVLGFEMEEQALRNGGVLLRVGGLYHRRKKVFRAGLGYEIAAPEWMLYSVSVETDFTDQLTVIPLIKAASPWMFLYIPSASIGAGLPVQIGFDGSTDVGIRVQADFIFGPLGVVLPFDFFPGVAEDDSRRMQFSALGQISF